MAQQAVLARAAHEVMARAVEPRAATVQAVSDQLDARIARLQAIRREIAYISTHMEETSGEGKRALEAAGPNDAYPPEAVIQVFARAMRQMCVDRSQYHRDQLMWEDCLGVPKDTYAPTAAMPVRLHNPDWWSHAGDTIRMHLQERRPPKGEDGEEVPLHRLPGHSARPNFFDDVLLDAIRCAQIVSEHLRAHPELCSMEDVVFVPPRSQQIRIPGDVNEPVEHQVLSQASIDTLHAEGVAIEDPDDFECVQAVPDAIAERIEHLRESLQIETDRALLGLEMIRQDLFSSVPGLMEFMRVEEMTREVCAAGVDGPLTDAHIDAAYACACRATLLVKDYLSVSPHDKLWWANKHKYLNGSIKSYREKDAEINEDLHKAKVLLIREKMLRALVHAHMMEFKAREPEAYARNAARTGAYSPEYVYEQTEMDDVQRAELMREAERRIGEIQPEEEDEIRRKRAAQNSWRGTLPFPAEALPTAYLARDACKVVAQRFGYTGYFFPDEP